MQLQSGSPVYRGLRTAKKINPAPHQPYFWGVSTTHKDVLMLKIRNSYTIDLPREVVEGLKGDLGSYRLRADSSIIAGFEESNV